VLFKALSGKAHRCLAKAVVDTLELLGFSWTVSTDS